jgi:hypothetical protein
MHSRNVRNPHSKGKVVNVQLPVIYCRCGSQLVSHICAVAGSDELVCIFCARDAARAGSGNTITPVYPLTGWGGMGFAPVLDAVDAVALLVRNGAAIIDG